MTEAEWRCGFGGSRKPNGNCEVVDPDDQLPVQGVGEWSLEKHNWLQRFIAATRATRAKYVPEGPQKGGSAYVDLFAGPGRVRVQDTKESQDGSPLIALAETRAPFSRVILADLDGENIAALRARTAAKANRTVIIEGDSNERIADIVKAIPVHGLNLAFVDPFGPSLLKWNTVAQLGAFSRMDMLVNMPTGFIKRNFDRESFLLRIDAMLGTAKWRDNVTEANEAAKLIEHLRAQLATLGYRPERSRVAQIKNTKNVLMFHLAFFSKHELGDKIWNSVVRTTPGGQTGFGGQGFDNA